MLTLIDSMVIPEEYMSRDRMTATEVRFRLDEFGNSKVVERLSRAMDDFCDIAIRRIFETPIQFKFPKSKKKRIRKKWRKDPRNFRKLLDDSIVDIQIVGMEN